MKRGFWIWIALCASLACFAAQAGGRPSSSQRNARVCSAMKAYAEINALSFELLSELQAISPELTSDTDQDLTPVLHRLSEADAEKASNVACRWISGIHSRLSQIDPVFTDLDSLNPRVDSETAEAELASSTADGDLDEMFCKRDLELGHTLLPQNPEYTYSDYTISLLIGRIKDQSESGGQVSENLWAAFQAGYGLSPETCQ